MMTPRERFMAALRLEPHDRIPLANGLGTFMQWDLAELDYTWEELFNDSDKLVYIEERCVYEYGNDSLTIPRDIRVEALGHGSRVGYNLSCGRGFRLPMVAEWVVSNEKELTKLKPFDPKKIPVMTMNLEVVARLREKFPDVAIIGIVNGIGSLHTDVVNDQSKFPNDSHGHFKTLLDNITTKPNFVHQVNEILVESSIAWGRALVEAGCDAIATHEVMAWLGITPEEYEEFIIQYQSRIRAGVGAPYIFAECAAEKVMDQIIATGAMACQIPDTVDLKWAAENYGNKLCFIGNLGVHRPNDILWSGTWQKVEEAARECIEIGKTMPGFMLSGGCEIHMGVPRQNVKAMYDAVKAYGIR